MNICMVLSGRDFPPDIRVEKESRALISAGHEVHLVCSNYGQQIAEFEGIKIHRVNALPQLLRKFNSFIYHIFFYNLLWAKEVGRILKDHKLEALHVHDLPLVATMISLGKKHHIPVVFDMHENFAERIKETEKKRTLKNLLTNNYWRYKRLEKRCAEHANHIIVVVQEAKDRLVDLGISADKITVIMNTEDIDYFLGMPIEQDLVEQFKENFVISYVGGFEENRGLETLVKAMLSVLSKIPDAHLLLVGEGRRKQALIQLCQELNILEYVTFTGWVEFSRVPTYISLSDVCVIPHVVNPHTDATIPHKLFQYMSLEKPVVATEIKPVKRIIESGNCGLVVPAENPEAMAEAILRLSDKSYARMLGANGKKIVQERYNWKTTSKELCALYERLALQIKD